jgi:hypothetical protein
MYHPLSTISQGRERVPEPAAKSNAAPERVATSAKKPPAPGRNSFPEYADQLAAPLLNMQRVVGNQAVQRMLRAHLIQAKLTINQPGDEYEEEADRVADQVMRMQLPDSASPPGDAHPQDLPLQRKCAECEEKEKVQRNSDGGGLPAAPPIVDEVLGSPGQPLDESTRSFFEPRFGRDFSRVRVHTDSQSSKSAESVNALAYTVGRDIVFSSGQFALETKAGSYLLAHELAHVVQQEGASSKLQKKGDEGRIATSTWTEAVRKATAALSSADQDAAQTLYQEAILMAAPGVTIPVGLPKVEPGRNDIRLDFKLSDFAETRGKEIPADESNYWHWIYFGPSSLMETQAHTQSVINHELVHARQYWRLWNTYKMGKSHDKSTWENFQKPFSQKVRVEGPEELEAEITSLPFLPHLDRKEKQLDLRGLFVAYINTTDYIPAKGEALAVTPPVAEAQILEAFKEADASLQGSIADALWWSLIKVDPSPESWKRVIGAVKSIAVRGYSDVALRPSYDAFLKLKGLSFSEILGVKAPSDATSNEPAVFQSPQNKLAVERAERLLPMMKAYAAEWETREIRRLHAADELDPLLENRRQMDIKSTDPGPRGLRAKIEEQNLAALNRRPLEIEVTEDAVRFRVKFHVRFEDPSGSSRLRDLQTNVVEGIKLMWNQVLQSLTLGGRHFTIEPSFTELSMQASRDHNYWLITVRSTDIAPVLYPHCRLDQPPAGVPTAVTDSTCDGGVMSLPPAAINKPDVLGHELLHLFGLVDRYVALTSVKPGQKPVTEESPTRETRGRPDPLGGQKGTILAEDLAFIFSRLGVYAMEENRGLETLRKLERAGMTIGQVRAEIHRQEEIIRLGRDPWSLIPERKDFRDKILRDADSR